MVFSSTGLPILCDLVGFTVLSLAAWWICKLGALTAIGLIETAVNFALNPQAVIFSGFTAASVVFDATSFVAGYQRPFKRGKITFAVAIFASVVSAAVAGTIIGLFFMGGPALAVW